MKVLVVADGHYYIDREKNVYVESVFDYSFYARYLSVFDEVYAIARMERVKEAPAGCKIASGRGVHFLPIPDSHGAAQFAKHYTQSKKLVEGYIKRFEVAIFRIPGVVANFVCPIYAKTGKKYAVEVVVDPWEYFAKGTVKGFSRPFVRIAWTHSLKRYCMDAIGVSYVTRKYLQKKYPCKALKGGSAEYFTSSYSSVELPDDQFGTARQCRKKDKYVISHVANAFTGYGKGHIPLMEAVKIVLDRGYDVEVWFVGDGPLKEEFIQYSKKLGIETRVKFLGRMPSGLDVRRKITESDIFVFPTRAEGLPRVVLEAMAEGLPVISSPTCGIPEILDWKFLCAYDDYNGYADGIIRFIENPALMESCSKANINMAKKFRSGILSKRRQEFYLRLEESVHAVLQNLNI